MLKLKITLALLIVMLAVSGCTLNLGQTKTDDTTNGGIFVSPDNGQTWQQQVAVPTTNGRIASIAALPITAMVMDPSDNKALYLGTNDKGVIVSYDAGMSWQPPRSKTIAGQGIYDIAVDPKDKCRLYGSVGYVLLKTVDCGRTWQVAYTDPNPATLVFTIVIDNSNPANVYLGLKNGNLLKSSDYGVSWQNIQNFKHVIKRIVINRADTRIILVGLDNGIIERSMDGGASWQDLSDRMKQFTGDKNLRDLVAIPSQPDGYLLALKYGLLKTVNNGNDWTEIKLVTPKQVSIINAVAVNYKNPNLIYYITDNTFYRTVDGGANWITTQIPTTRRAWKILTDPLTDGLIYLAVRE